MEEIKCVSYQKMEVVDFMSYHTLLYKHKNESMKNKRIASAHGAYEKYDKRYMLRGSCGHIILFTIMLRV